MNTNKKRKKKINKLLIFIVTFIIAPTIVIILATQTDFFLRSRNYPVRVASYIKTFEEAQSIRYDSSEVTILYNNYSNTYTEEPKIFYYGCFLYALFTNTGDDDIRITGFTVDGNTIIDESPLMYAVAYTMNEELLIYLENNGWGTAKNLKVNISGDGLMDYVGQPNITIDCGDITPGYINDGIVCLSYDNLINTDNLTRQDYITIPLRGEYTYDGIDEAIEFNMPVIAIVKDSLHNELDDYGNGEGDYEDYHCGIIINTDNDKFYYYKSTNQIIPAHQTVLLPICIAPNKSCLMDFTIEFETNFEEKLFSFDFEDIEFIIPYYKSFAGYTIIDGSDYNHFKIKDPVKYFPYDMVKEVLDTDEPDPIIDNIEVEIPTYTPGATPYLDVNTAFFPQELAGSLYSISIKLDTTEVEGIIGPPNSIEFMEYYPEGTLLHYYYDYCEIWFAPQFTESVNDDGEYVMELMDYHYMDRIIVTDPEYEGPRGIKIGDSVEEVFEKFNYPVSSLDGTSIIYDENDILIDLSWEDNQLKSLYMSDYYNGDDWLFFRISFLGGKVENMEMMYFMAYE